MTSFVKVFSPDSYSAHVPRSGRRVSRFQSVGVAAAVVQVADTIKVHSQLSACNISLSD